jgi:hypothetical protein
MSSNFEHAPYGYLAGATPSIVALAKAPIIVRCAGLLLKRKSDTPHNRFQHKIVRAVSAKQTVEPDF